MTTLKTLLVATVGLALASASVMAAEPSNPKLGPKPATKLEKVIGGKLDTYVYVPKTEPKLAGKRALMVSLHGCIQTNDDMYQGAGWQPVADEYGMVVALPQSSWEGLWGSKAGCWNFHVGMEASRDKTDAGYLVAMVEELLADKALNIDPNQVYITGISSGGAMAHQMGCLAPDLFAGIGGVAGLAGGSFSATNKSLFEAEFTPEEGKQRCEALAGKHKTQLKTQIRNSIHGAADKRVSSIHVHHTADVGVAIASGEKPLKECRTAVIPGFKEGQHGDLTAWCDVKGEQVSKILVQGLGHLWPAGSKSKGGGYIDHEHINYPEWITQWFFENNRRVQR